MNLTEVVSEVLSIIKRPDKVADVRRAVNGAVRYCCMSTDFARDLQERSITIDSASYAQSLLLSEFVRFRKFEYIKPAGQNRYICPMDSTKIFAKNQELLDSYYVAGDQVNFKISVLASSLLIGWYAYPSVLTDQAPTFWLLDAAPYMIIDKAAATIFNDIGDEKSSAKKELEFKEQYMIAIRDLKYGASHG